MFYGSVGVLIGFVILFAVLVPSVRYEERALEARFGDPYRAYRGQGPAGPPQSAGLRRRPSTEY